MRDLTTTTSPEGASATTTSRTFGGWGALLGVATLAVVALGIVDATHVRNAALWDVCDAVIVCWVVAGRTTFTIAPRLGLTTSAGALVAAVAASAGRIAQARDNGLHGHAQVVASLFAPVAMAISVHVLLSLPDGALRARSRQLTAALWYTLAGGAAIYLATTTHVLPTWPINLGWAFAVATTLPSLQRPLRECVGDWTPIDTEPGRRGLGRAHGRGGRRDDPSHRQLAPPDLGDLARRLGARAARTRRGKLAARVARPTGCSCTC